MRIKIFTAMMGEKENVGTPFLKTIGKKRQKYETYIILLPISPPIPPSPFNALLKSYGIEYQFATLKTTLPPFLICTTSLLCNTPNALPNACSLYPLPSTNSLFNCPSPVLQPTGNLLRNSSSTFRVSSWRSWEVWEREEEEEEVAACMVEARKRRMASSTWDSVTREVRVSLARDSEMRVICFGWGVVSLGYYMCKGRMGVG